MMCIDENLLNNNPKKFEFVLQWHLTTKCNYQCQHCYVKDPTTYNHELENELDLHTCLNIIDDYSVTLKHWGVSGRINFTGGDPLLKEDFFDIFKYARDKGINVGILGNPDTLNFEIAKEMKQLGIFRYQISIDGLESTHDKIRNKKGSFITALNALDILKSIGIPSVVMYTLNHQNSHQLIDIIELVAKKEVSIFDFARYTPIVNKENLYLGKKFNYRSLLLDVLEKYKELEEAGCKTYFGRKDPLWALLYHELGLLRTNPYDKMTIYNGCQIGCGILTILADGTILPCRRLPIKIGKVPEQSIKDIFIYSTELKEMRDITRLKKCNKCDIRQYCRGCRSVAYETDGDYFSIDPQCWKEGIC